jgi:hypothetical protein
MPLTGELEHLPIVDLVQLIHSTRKSGTLTVFSRKGEGRLIFSNGFIISASHAQEQVRIGKILLENQLISQDELSNALALQQELGNEHKPLIAILLTICKLSKKQAFKALETLIEMTLVEMISWTRGVFTFDSDSVAMADEYRYLPQSLQEVALDTQMILMDALRIFDEKVHNGEIEIVDEPLEYDPRLNGPEANNIFGTSNTIETTISEDILGLADLDKVERKIPQVFKGLEPFDANELRREITDNATESLNEEHKEKLSQFLSNLSKGSPKTLFISSHQAIILFADDPFLEQAIMTVCKHEGRFVFNARTQLELEALTRQAIVRGVKPLVILSAPSDGIPVITIQTVRNSLLDKFMNIDILQLAFPSQLDFQLQAWKDGLKTVLPLPENKESPDYAEQMISFLLSFQVFLSDQKRNTNLYNLLELKKNLEHLRQFKRAADVSTEILRFISRYFERTINFVINKQELIAERSVGILNSEKKLSKTLMWRFSFSEDSRLQQIFNINECYTGTIQDEKIGQQLYAKIGGPDVKECLLLPLKCNNQTIMMIYADNGSKPAQQIDSDFFNFFICQAGLVMENALYRKQLVS